MRRLIPAALLTLPACTEPVPATVYVPAPAFAQSVQVAAQPAGGATRPGEWVTLAATLQAGPWRAISRDSADLTGCWWTRPPADVDTNAASRVTWRVEPAESVVFNQPRPPAWVRQVRFPRPGTYRLWALAPGCGTPVQSDTLHLQIQP